MRSTPAWLLKDEKRINRILSSNDFQHLSLTSFFNFSEERALEFCWHSDVQKQPVMRKIENLIGFPKLHNLSGTNAVKDVMFSFVCTYPCLCRHADRQVKIFGFTYNFCFF